MNDNGNHITFGMATNLFLGTIATVSVLLTIVTVIVIFFVGRQIDSAEQDLEAVVESVSEELKAVVDSIAELRSEMMDPDRGNVTGRLVRLETLHGVELLELVKKVTVVTPEGGDFEFRPLGRLITVHIPPGWASPPSIAFLVGPYSPSPRDIETITFPFTFMNYSNFEITWPRAPGDLPQAFELPTVEFKYSLTDLQELDVSDSSRLTIAKFDDVVRSWSIVDSEVIPEANLVSFRLSGPGKFVVGVLGNEPE